MTDRTVRVRLEAAVQGYIAHMKQAQAATKSLGSDVAKMSRSNEQEMRTIGIAAAATGGAIAAGFVFAGKATMDFDKQMSAVGAVANATAEDLARLREAALKAGADTAFSASEAALAQEELVKAGISVEDVLGGALDGALALAAAGQIELADAATIAAQAMNIFKLEGSDVSHVADLLAAGANKSAADVGQLGDALRQGGLVAAQTGLSIEETTAALSLFADNALIGSDAGTSLKTMLQRLTPQSVEARNLMSDLGFSAYDAGGNFIGLAGLADELQTALGDMTTEQRNSAMATLFGSDAVRGANVLYAAGADEIREYIAAVDDQGAAADVAAKRLDNLAGDIEELGGSIETALITNGGFVNGILRTMAQNATDLVNVYNDLPTPVQATATGLGAVAGAAGLAGGAFFLAAPQVVAFSDAVKTLQKTAAGGKLIGALSGVRSLLMGPWGIALAGATAAVGLLVNAKMDVIRRSEEFAATLDVETGALTQNSRAYVANDLHKRGLIDTGREFGLSVDTLVDAMLGEADALRLVQAATEENREAHMNWGGTAEGAKSNGDRLVETIARLAGEHATTADAARREQEIGAELEGQYLDLAHAIDSGLDPSMARLALAHQAAADAEADAEGGSEDLIKSFDDQTMSVEDLDNALDAYSDALDRVLGSHFSVEEANDRLTEQYQALEDQVADAIEAEDKNARALDGNSEAALANREALRAVVEETANTVEAMAEQGASSEEIQAKLATERARLLDVFEQLGFNREEVARYIDAFDAIPTDVGTRVDVDASGALGAIDDVIGRLRQAGFSQSNAVWSARLTAQGHAAGAFENHAGGWAGTGPKHTGPLRPDEVPAVLQTGEFVLSRAMIRRMGGVPKFHDGGPVTGGPYDSGLIASLVKDAKNQSLAGYTDALGQVDRLMDRWDQIVQREDQASARADLAEAVSAAEQDLRAAKTKDERRRATEALSDATERLADHDRDAARAAEEAAIADAKAVLEERARRVENRENFEYAQMTAQQRIVMLNRQLAAETAFTDEWMDLYEERADAVADLEKAYDDELDALRGMLDDRQQILDRIGDLEDRHHTERLAAVDRYLHDRQALMDARREELLAGLAIDAEGFQAGVLANTLASGNADLQQWSTGLAQLRGRGLSEDVIAQLGLGKGDARAMQRVRDLLAGTDTELADLNRVIADRMRLINDQVAAEAESSTYELGRRLETMRLDHLEQLRKMDAEFLAEQQALRDELAQVGLDNGLSYADAIAEGIASGIPAIEAQVRRVQQAMRDMKAAQAAADSDMDRVAQLRASLGLKPESASDLIWQRRLSSGEADWAEVERRLRERASTYDSGGVLQPGYTLARNATGKPEYVLTGAQLAAVAAGGGHGSLTIVLEQDRREVARTVAPIVADEVRVKLGWKP